MLAESENVHIYDYADQFLMSAVPHKVPPTNFLPALPQAQRASSSVADHHLDRKLWK